MVKRLLGLRFNLVFNCVMLALLGVGVGLTSLLLGSGTGLRSIQPDMWAFGLQMFFSYFSSPLILILNLLPPLVLIFVVYFISGRAWVAFLSSSVVVFALSTVHFFKLQIRGDPFIVEDFLYIREAGTFAASYGAAMNWKVYFMVVAFICGVAFSVFVLKYRLKNPRGRIIGGVSSVVAFSLLYATVYTDVPRYEARIPQVHQAQWSESLHFITKGFMYPFIHSIQHARPGSIPQPEGYDEDAVRLLFESYENVDIPDDKKVNVLTIMLEAYADLSVFGVLDFKYDVYGPWHSLQEESIHGMLICNVFGGLTIDTERLFLTGYTRLTTYNAPVNTYVRYFNDQGYHTEGLLPVAGWFYDRKAINRHLGFAEYYFIEDFQFGSMYDAFFFPTILELYHARDRGVPYFAYHLSAQNHGPYYSHWTREPHVIEHGDFSLEAFNILNNFLSGIADTTRRAAGLIDALRDDPDPVVVLMFGDHMPWLGNNDSVYHELGINIDRSTEEGFLNYFSTPYIIWANDAAKAVLGNDFVGYGGSFSPTFLMGELFRHCSWEGEAYMQALRELMAFTDVLNERVGVFRENGVLTTELSPEAQEVYNKVQKMEYFRLNNFWGAAAAAPGVRD